MKNLFILIFVCFVLNNVSGQGRDSITEKDKEEIFYTKVDEKPEFKGGNLKWQSFIKRNLDSDIPTRNKAAKGDYAVIVKFMIKKDGSIGDVVAETNNGYGMEEEVIRIIKKSPAWEAGKINNEKVNSYQRQKIVFYVSKNPESERTAEELLKPDVEAVFPGTIVDWRNFLRNNFDERVPYFNSAPIGRYKVIVRFIVDVDGTISDVMAETNNGYGMEKEAIRVIKISPKWIPGKVNGVPVKTRLYQPFTFVVNEE